MDGAAGGVEESTDVIGAGLELGSTVLDGSKVVEKDDGDGSGVLEAGTDG